MVARGNPADDGMEICVRVTAPPPEIPKMATSLLAKGSSGDFYCSESLVWVLERTLLCLGVAGVAGMLVDLEKWGRGTAAATLRISQIG
jgi:hypothetical protein